MVKNLFTALLLILFVNANCFSQEFSKREMAAKNIVDAVNAKDSDMYTSDLSEDVLVTMYDGAIVLEGLAAIKENRQQHFERYPNARNKLVHVIQIDDRVVMHDLVWLSNEQIEPANIVEIFTFEGDKIIRIDVIQPKDLNIRRD